MSFVFPKFDAVLTGYGRSSPSLVDPVKSFVGHAHRNPYQSCTHPKTDYIVRIDKPRAIDSDGDRIDPAAALLPYLGFPGFQDDYGTYTHLTFQSTDGSQHSDGAYLRCENVVIPARQGLWFRYAFIAFDRLSERNNDAAVVIAEDEANRRVGEVIYDISRFGSRGGNRQTDWTEKLWHPSPGQEFRGTVYWVMLNGQMRSDRSHPPDDSIRVYPSCLLLDAIELRDL